MVWSVSFSSLPTCCLCFFFFFQAEDGIRDLTVTGVQTCALPIFLRLLLRGDRGHERRVRADGAAAMGEGAALSPRRDRRWRSEERRVGKECRSRWSPDH